MQLADKTAQSAHGREKEKMRLADMMANREHKRQLEALRHKDRSAATKAKLKIQAAKKAVGRPPAEEGAAKKTAKKPPPRRRDVTCRTRVRPSAGTCTPSTRRSPRGGTTEKKRQASARSRRHQSTRAWARLRWVGGVANQIPQAQDAGEVSGRRKKGRIKKMLRAGLRRPLLQPATAAQKAFDLVMKMDDDTAEMFTHIVVSELFEQDIEKNLGTLQRHLNEVVSKRLADLKNGSAPAGAQGLDPEAGRVRAAMFEIERLQGADPEGGRGEALHWKERLRARPVLGTVPRPRSPSDPKKPCSTGRDRDGDRWAWTRRTRPSTGSGSIPRSGRVPGRVPAAGRLPERGEPASGEGQPAR